MVSEIRQCALIVWSMRLIFAVLIIGASSSWVVSQTIADVQRNFSPSDVPGRFVGAGFELLVWFDGDEKVCRALWPANAFQNGVINVGDTKISSAEIKRVLDLIAPSEFRGLPADPWGKGMLYGNMGDQNYAYEKLTLTLYFSFNAAAVANRLESQQNFILLDRPEDEVTENWVDPRKQAQEIISASVVEVKWKTRKCVE